MEFRVWLIWNYLNYPLVQVFDAIWYLVNKVYVRNEYVSRKIKTSLKYYLAYRILVLFVYVCKEDNWTTWKDWWEIRAVGIFEQLCPFFSILRPSLGRFISKDFYARTCGEKSGNVRRSATRASPLPVINGVIYLSSARERNSKGIEDIELLYIYIQLCYTYLITIFWEETLFWIKLNKTPFRTLSLFFANLRKLHEQLILVTLERKKEKKRSMFVMESIWGWYIHSSPVTNRSVKESKYTVRGIFWPAGLQTRLHGCYGGTYAPIVQGCIRVSILQHLPCTRPCRVYMYIHARFSIDRTMLSSYRYCLAAIICEPRS